MKGFYLEALGALSLVGSIFLVRHKKTCLGALLISEYEYVPLNDMNKQEAGMTCIWAAGLYLVVLAIIVALIGKKTRSAGPFPRNDSEEDEEAPFLQEI